MPVQNAEIAAMFDQAAELLEVQGEINFALAPAQLTVHLFAKHFSRLA